MGNLTVIFCSCFGIIKSPFYANRPSGDRFGGKKVEIKKKKRTCESNFSQFMTAALLTKQHLNCHCSTEVKIKIL